MKQFRVKILIAMIWLIFTVSLTGWWFVHAWGQIDISAGDRARSMLQWEGLSLLLALLLGGAAIIYLIHQERKSYRTLNDFHMAFSHDLKNTLTSLQMQIGALRDACGNEQNPVLDRLGRDGQRLQMQLENSLELSKLEMAPLLMEDMLLSGILAHVRFFEPDVELSLDRDPVIRGDRRALEIIFWNLLNNAIKHGGASRIRIESKDLAGREVSLRVADNGSGFEGPRQRLAQMFFRPSSTSGTGVGLYLAKRLIGKMDGRIAFDDPRPGEGFVAVLTVLSGGRP